MLRPTFTGYVRLFVDRYEIKGFVGYSDPGYRIPFAFGGCCWRIQNYHYYLLHKVFDVLFI